MTGRTRSERRRQTRWWLLTAIATVLLLPTVLVSVAVSREPEEPPVHAFALDAQGDAVPLGTLGGRWSMALGVNESGAVVGMAEGSDGSVHGFLSKNGTMTDLGPWAKDAFALALNDRGEIVGSAGGSTGVERAVLWAEGRMTVLPSGDGVRSVASDINDRGQIVGTVTLPPSRDPAEPLVRSRAVVWEGGVLRQLGNGPTASTALRINDLGQVLGSEDGRVILWSEGRALDLGAGHPIDLNDAGQVLLLRPGGGAEAGTYLWQAGRFAKVEVRGRSLIPIALGPGGSAIARADDGSLWRLDPDRATRVPGFGEDPDGKRNVTAVSEAGLVVGTRAE